MGKLILALKLLGRFGNLSQEKMSRLIHIASLYNRPLGILMKTNFVCYLRRKVNFWLEIPRFLGCTCLLA